MRSLEGKSKKQFARAAIHSIKFTIARRPALALAAVRAASSLAPCSISIYKLVNFPIARFARKPDEQNSVIELDQTLVQTIGDELFRIGLTRPT